MNPFRTRCVAVLAAASATVALATSPASACLAAQTEFPYVLSTGSSAGTADPFGTVDSEWLLTSAPLPIGLTVPKPVFSVKRYPSWIEPRPIANWIHPDATGNVSGPAGTYVFRTAFNVPWPMTVESLAFQFAADNSVTFYLNGNNIGSVPGPTGFAQWHTLYLANPPVGQVNILEAHVVNDGGPYGLVVAGGANLCV
jgi:hypothetical protein